MSKIISISDPTNLSLSRDLSSSMRLRRSSSRCSRKRCAARACCLSSSNFRCRSSFCLSRTSFALSNSFELPVDSRPVNSHVKRTYSLYVRLNQLQTTSLYRWLPTNEKTRLEINASSFKVLCDIITFLFDYIFRNFNKLNESK